MNISVILLLIITVFGIFAVFQFQILEPLNATTLTFFFHNVSSNPLTVSCRESSDCLAGDDCINGYCVGLHRKIGMRGLYNHKSGVKTDYDYNYDYTH